MSNVLALSFLSAAISAIFAGCALVVYPVFPVAAAIITVPGLAFAGVALVGAFDLCCDVYDTFSRRRRGVELLTPDGRNL